VPLKDEGGLPADEPARLLQSILQRGQIREQRRLGRPDIHHARAAVAKLRQGGQRPGSQQQDNQASPDAVHDNGTPSCDARPGASPTHIRARSERPHAWGVPRVLHKPDRPCK
jgi:hypothetical protein